MSKGSVKKHKHGFLIGMIVYALVVLAAAWFGLRYFWNYIEAYELSRPEHALDSYIAQLDKEHICDLSQEVIDRVDHHIQSEAECREYLSSQLGEVRYSKNLVDSTEDCVVYTLRSGANVIGRIQLVPERTDEYSFTYWTVTGESFDLSYLLGNAQIEITVPEDFRVSVNGAELGEAYVTEQDVPYDAFEEFYGEYELPSMTTYRAGPFLGEYTFEVTDSQGSTVVIDETTDCAQFVVNNCAEDTVEDLDKFVDVFVRKLVAFTGSSRNAASQNYRSLAQHIMDASALMRRMESAIDTLQFSHNSSDIIAEITVNHYYQIEEGKYLCDVTYLVDTTGTEGVTRTVNNIKIIVVDSFGTLKALAMTSY